MPIGGIGGPSEMERQCVLRAELAGGSFCAADHVIALAAIGVISHELDPAEGPVFSRA